MRILWASWHLVTIFGAGLGVILLFMAVPDYADRLETIILNIVLIAMLCGSLLVFIATKARHPGWIGLLGVVILVWLT